MSLFNNKCHTVFTIVCITPSLLWQAKMAFLVLLLSSTHQKCFHFHHKIHFRSCIFLRLTCKFTNFTCLGHKWDVMAFHFIHIYLYPRNAFRSFGSFGRSKMLLTFDGEKEKMMMTRRQQRKQ